GTGPATTPRNGRGTTTVGPPGPGRPRRTPPGVHHRPRTRQRHPHRTAVHLRARTHPRPAPCRPAPGLRGRRRRQHTRPRPPPHRLQRRPIHTLPRRGRRRPPPDPPHLRPRPMGTHRRRTTRRGPGRRRLLRGQPDPRPLRRGHARTCTPRPGHVHGPGTTGLRQRGHARPGTARGRGHGPLGVLRTTVRPAPQCALHRRPAAGQTGPPGQPRPTHRPGQPDTVERTRTSGDRQRRTPRHRGRIAADGPRPVQRGQRHLRPRHRGPPAPGRGTPPHPQRAPG